MQFTYISTTKCTFTFKFNNAFSKVADSKLPTLWPVFGQAFDWKCHAAGKGQSLITTQMTTPL